MGFQVFHQAKPTSACKFKKKKKDFFLVGLEILTFKNRVKMGQIDCINFYRPNSPQSEVSEIKKRRRKRKKSFSPRGKGAFQKFRDTSHQRVVEGLRVEVHEPM